VGSTGCSDKGYMTKEEGNIYTLVSEEYFTVSRVED
jgi:hypothetical protein